MLRSLTLIMLVLSSLWCLAVIAFAWDVLLKSGFNEPVMLTVGLGFALMIAGMWLAFRRRRFEVALGVAAIPPFVTILLLSQVGTRLF